MSRRINLNAINFDETDVTSGIRIDNSIEKYRFTLDETEHDHLLGGPGNAGHTSPLSNRADLPFSISAWVNLREAPLDKFNSIVTKWSQGVGGLGAKEFLFSIVKSNVSGTTRTRLIFALYDDVSNTGTQNRFRGSVDFPLNQWVHVVVTYGANPDGENDVTDITVYQDGTELINDQDGQYQINDNYEAMPAYNDSFSPLVIGNVNKYIKDGVHEEMPFRGKIADVCIFNKKLSESEVTEIYNNGAVKNMANFSDTDSLVSWWKLGDDLDSPRPDGIKNYIEGANHGTISGAATIVPEPSLLTDRVRDKNHTHTARSPSRQPKNLANDHQVFIHGGIGGDMPTQDPTQASPGVVATNQKILHTFWKAEAGAGKTHNIKVFGFSYASGQWAPLNDIYGDPIELTTTDDPVDKYRLFEISGVDKLYFKQTGDALVDSDLFAAAVSSL